MGNRKVIILLILAIFFISLASAEKTFIVEKNDSEEQLYEEEVLEIDLIDHRAVSEVDIRNVIEITNPEELGIKEVRADNINIHLLGTKVSFQHETTLALIKENTKTLESQPGYQKFLEASRGIRTKTRKPLTITRYLEVYEIAPIYANVVKKTYKSKEVLEFRAEEDFKEVWILQIYPEEILINYSDIGFGNKSGTLLEEKPIALHWSFDNVREGDVLQVTNYIKNLIVGDEENIIVAIGAPVRLGLISASNNQATGLAISGFGTEFEESLKKYGLNFSSFLIVVSLIAVAIFSGGIVLMELENKNTFKQIKNIFRSVHVCMKIGYKNKNSMDNYVKECMKKGFALEKIRTSLIRAGWDKDCVKKILRKYR